MPGEAIDGGPDSPQARRDARPRILCDPAAVAAGSDPGAAGAIWKLQSRDRGLDANVIQLPPGGAIGRHEGPDLDVLLHVLRGSGQLGTELGTLDLRPGALVWLPRRSQRQFTAGPGGLAFLTVHQHRPAAGLSITRRPAGQ
jgi:quercetin dioxygenase-like cupin family protein